MPTYDRIQPFYEGTEPGRFDKLTGETLNRPLKQLSVIIDEISNRVARIPSLSGSYSSPNDNAALSVTAGYNLNNAIQANKSKLDNLVIDSHSATDTDKAGSAKAVKDAYDLAQRALNRAEDANGSIGGLPGLSDSITSDNPRTGASSKAAKILNDKIEELKSQLAAVKTNADKVPTLESKVSTIESTYAKKSEIPTNIPSDSNINSLIDAKLNPAKSALESKITTETKKVADDLKTLKDSLATKSTDEPTDKTTVKGYLKIGTKWIAYYE